MCGHQRRTSSGQRFEGARRRRQDVAGDRPGGGLDRDDLDLDHVTAERGGDPRVVDAGASTVVGQALAVATRHAPVLVPAGKKTNAFVALANIEGSGFSSLVYELRECGLYVVRQLERTLLEHTEAQQRRPQ